MPVVIKSGRLKYKDSQGEYVGIDAIADKTTAQKVAEITAAGTTQLAAVNGAGATQTAAVNNAGAAQVQAVQTKGTEVLESIPDEYEELSENVVALQSAINVLDGILVTSGESESATLENLENVNAYRLNAAGSFAYSEPSYSDGVATFVNSSSGAYSGEKSPYVSHDLAKGSGTWLCGFKFKFSKLDNSVSEPEQFRIWLGSSTITDFNVVWDQWIEFANYATIDLTRIRIAARNFTTAPTSNQIQLQIKDMYLYNIASISSDMRSYIIEQQNDDYQDGTVTYILGEEVKTPDTTLSISGKAADSKATGDAISAKLSANQTAANAGKILGVGQDGTVVPQAVSDVIDADNIEYDDESEYSVKSIGGKISSIDNELYGMLVVASQADQETLINIENVSEFSSHLEEGSGSGDWTKSYSDGLLTMITGPRGQEQSPYFSHSGNWGTKKWVCGFKYKVTKLDQNLGNPECIRIHLGATNYYDSDVAWGEWVNFSKTISVDLTRIRFAVRGFATAPTSGQLKIEIKEMYLYNASGVSDDMCAYVMEQQSTNYTDGTVTYDKSATYALDTSLSESGKIPDSKAVGDAIKTTNNIINVKDFGAKGDGETDDTAALRTILSSKTGNFYFPSGTYKVTGTLTLPEGSSIIGDGDTSIINMYSCNDLLACEFRGGDKVYPYILINQENCAIRKIKLTGNNNLQQKRHAGIGVLDTNRCAIEDVTIYNINFDAEQDNEAIVSGYGICVTRSEYVSIARCNVQVCGYECIGVVDDCNYCSVRDCYTQDGWRTCIQVHRGSCNTLIENCYMKQTHTKYDACFTVHGLPDLEVKNLHVINCVAECTQNGAQTNDYCAPYQIMSDAHCLVFIGNRAFGGKRAFYIYSDSTNAKIIGNDFQCNSSSDYGVSIHALSSIIIGNNLVNNASTPVNFISNNPIILGNIGIS